MATRDDTAYFRLRERTSLAMASIAADPAARFSHRELARQYRLRRDGTVVGRGTA